MKIYIIAIPISIDSNKFIKYFNVNADNVINAHYKSLAYLNNAINEMETEL